ncbi:MAG: MBL fold metallo-hydrolase [Erythrobacter sp.]|uniref:MBL fold metallo-hydrolase n=1 Tax=Erythrobacter sp. TaxID=1042 RepID=UPI00329918F7
MNAQMSRVRGILKNKGFASRTAKTACALVLAAGLWGCGDAYSQSITEPLQPAAEKATVQQAAGQVSPELAAAGQAAAILNAGVMTTHDAPDGGSAKFLFDPLYDDHFGSLAELTPELISAIIAGDAPYDEVDAVFVSHAHGDHFSVSQLTKMMDAQDQLVLVIPAQGLERLRGGPDWSADFETRVRPITLENGEASKPFEVAGAKVDAFRSPHAGWPERHAQVHNITYRVSVADEIEAGKVARVSRVMHLGDADPAAQHFSALEDLLQAQRTGLAIVPFWFTRADDPSALSNQTLNAQTMVAVHVPVDVPEDLKTGKWAYFSKVGEVLEIPVSETIVLPTQKTE